MIMEQLLTASEFRSYHKVAKKADDKVINECILKAQQSDLISVLGDFYFDVLANHQDATYGELMEGSMFEYEGYNYEQVGLKEILNDYAYSRYIYNKNVNDTSFGMVQKKDPYSEPVDRGVLKDMARQSQQDGGYKFKYIDLYLKANKDLFPRYSKCENKETRNYKAFKTTVF